MKFFKNWTSKKRRKEGIEDLKLINRELHNEIIFEKARVTTLSVRCSQQEEDIKKYLDKNEELWKINGKLIVKIAGLQTQKDGLIDYCNRLRKINGEYEKQYSDLVTQFRQREWDLLSEIEELNMSLQNCAKTLQQRVEITNELRIKIARLSAIVEERMLLPDSN